MRDLIAQLESVREAAPPEVALGTQLETGLADALITVSSPVGPLHVTFNDAGVSGSSLLPDRTEFQAAFIKRFGRPALPVAAPPAPLARKIDQALDTGRVGRLPLDLSGVTPFQRQVLELVATIPPGEVRPYSWVAAAVGRPGASRAVGSTMATNPVPVLVPCHRVVRSDGAIGNYLFGPETKTALLNGEGMDVDDHIAAVEAGYRLTGSDTTGIACYPTCRHARRTTDRHRQWFRSAAEARRAGYRPCKVCRPLMTDG